MIEIKVAGMAQTIKGYIKKHITNDNKTNINLGQSIQFILL